jgi:DHA2 family multidrug resistance protein-like MFS transporter
MTAAALNAVPTAKAGMASGVLLMSRMVGATLGVATAGALFQALEQRRLDDLGSHLSRVGLRDATHILSGSGDANAGLDRLPPSSAHAVRAVARDAFTSGLTGAMALCAAVAALAGILVFFLGRAQERIAPSAATSASTSAESL